jgi:predicted alpha-1,2-mannosidase
MLGADTPAAARDYTALVEPRLGTIQTRWLAFSSACRPFGLVNLSPDTRLEGDWGCGYSFDDDTLLGFSHVHDWQIGALLAMPVLGPLDPRGGPPAWASRFAHAEEMVRPGYHRVQLRRWGIAAELTATTRVGLHRYAFPAGHEAAIVLDLASTLGPSAMGAAALRRLDARRLEGSVVNLPTRRRPKPLRVYFALALDRDAAFAAYRADTPLGRVAGVDGEQLRARLDLGRPAGPVTLQVALSYTSCAAAWANLRAEVAGGGFDDIRRAARDEWQSWLARIEVEGGTEEQRGRFYADLYFALLGRRTASDHAGTYIDNTGPAPAVRQIPLDEAGQPRYRHFNSDAFWGAQWSIIPLWSLAYPEMIDQFCACFLDMYRNGGLIPRGPSGGNDTYVMTSAPTTPLFVSAVHQGIGHFADREEVYRALRKNHFPGGLMSKGGYEHESCRGGGIEDYLALGYIPEDLPPVGFHNNGAAQTLEHAYNDWCLAQLARTWGKDDDARQFAARARHYRHLFDRRLGFMRPRRRDGSWLEPYDPGDKRGWTEANGWTYTFYVPHDVPGLIACFGSAERFFARLEECLARAERGRFVAPHGRHEENTLDYGNEPALAVAHLFHLAGRPARTQYWVRRIFDTLKSGNSPRDGYGGDEDQGIMGAWNALVALGLFSVDGACGATATYQLTTPLFERITIHRDARYGAEGPFTIEVAGDQGGGLGYVQAAELDGAPLAGPTLTHAQFRAGRRLALQVGTEPR